MAKTKQTNVKQIKEVRLCIRIEEKLCTQLDIFCDEFRKKTRISLSRSEAIRALLSESLNKKTEN